MHRNKLILTSTTTLIGTAFLLSASPALSRTNNATLTETVILEASEIYINNGTISTDNNGITATDDINAASITNNGTINVDNIGILIEEGSSLSGGITNASNGLVTAGLTGIKITGASELSGSITNSGSIIGEALYGISIDNSSIGGSITNNSNGLINGVQTGISITSSLISGGISNSGSILGNIGIAVYTGSSVSGGITNNSIGIILGNNSGITISNASISGGITNSGSIIGDTSIGINITDGASLDNITNASIGFISGASTGIRVSASTISGAITNSGTITAAENAIFLSGLSDNVNIIVSGNNAHIIGNVEDDNISGGHSIVQISGNFITEGNWNVSNLTVDSGKTFTISNNNTVTLDHMSASAGTFRFAVNGVSDAGMLVVNGDGQAINLTGAKVAVNVLSTAELAAGDEILIGTGDAAVTGLAEGRTSVTDNSFLWDFTVGNGSTAVSENTSDLYLFAAENTFNYDNSGAAEAIANLSTNEDERVQATLTNLGNSSGAETERVLESLSPASDGSSFVASQTIVNSVNNLSTERLASLRDGTASSGVATGTYGSSNNIWAQAFGKTAQQDMRNNVSGYDADTAGVAIGLDTGAMNDTANVGIALGMANTDVSSDNLAATETDINSYQVSFYSDVMINDITFIGGNIGYVYGNNESTRNNVGGAGFVGTGEFDSQQVTALARVGQNYRVSSSVVTLSALAHYVSYWQDGYTETGNAGPLLLTVDDTDFQAFELGVVAEVSQDFRMANGYILRPALRAGYRHEFLDEDFASTASFTGGGTFATNGLDPADDTLDLGASLKLISADTWNVTADYGYEFKQDYDSHTGMLNVGYRF